MKHSPPPLSREECRRRLAANLPRIMSEKQTSVGPLAEAAGVCRRVLHRAVLGETDPAVSLVARVAMTLGVDILRDMLRPVPQPKKKTKRA